MTIFANDIPTLCRMAGYFDGEGCVLVFKYKTGNSGRWIIRIQSGDRDNLELFVRAGGNICRLGRRPKERVIKYAVAFSGQKFLELAIELEPYLIAKQEQMSYAIDSYCSYREARLKGDKQAAIQITVEAKAHLEKLKTVNYYPDAIPNVTKTTYAS